MKFDRRNDEVNATIVFNKNGQTQTVTSKGNGSLDAVSNALKEYSKKGYELLVYTEHSMQEKGSGSKAVAYIGLKDEKGDMYWGAGTDTDIIHAGVNALLSAFYNMTKN